MKFRPYESVSITCPLIVMLILSLWDFEVSKVLNLPKIGFFVTFVFACHTFGVCFCGSIEKIYSQRAEFPLQFLCGFFIFNTALFLMALVTPFGIAADMAILVLLSICIVCYQSYRGDIHLTLSAPYPILAVVVLSAVAASLWCSDALNGQFTAQQHVIFPVWQDMFIHAREISVFAQSHGAGTISDIKLSGLSAPIYHFASYVSPAAIVSITEAHAVDVYSSFQLPFGVMLTGLAASALASSFWGRWSGLAGAAAILLVPDAYQQGLGNRYLGYNFMTQVNLGMLYGISCVAIAWIFVLNGCRQKRLFLVFLGYCFLFASLFHKAHVFVANAFLLMIYPIIFFANIKKRIRLMLAVVSLILFVSVVTYSQTLTRVPILKLDGSGISKYIVILINNSNAGLIKNFFQRFFLTEHHSKVLQGIFAVLMIGILTFGVWLFAWIIALEKSKGRIEQRILLFPVFIVINYLIMAIGLAIDSRGVGAPEELLNRPLSWAYFGLVSWTAGALYYFTFGNAPPTQTYGKVMAGVILSVGLLGVKMLSGNLQTQPAWSGYGTYSEFNSAPLCLVKSAEYIRQNSPFKDLIQDSNNDPKLIVTAIAERQLFVGDSDFGGVGMEQSKRILELEQWSLMSDVDEIRAFAAMQQIQWYLVQPPKKNFWPKAIGNNISFKCDDYIVYHFP